MSQEASQLVKRLKLLPDNRECADCHEKRPEWASSKLGIFICLNCSGIHRNLGTHISFVRSCTLDSWTDEQANVMRMIGNRRANEYWEYKLPKNFQRPKSSNRAEMEDFIRRKYVDREFAKPNCKAPNEIPLSRYKALTDDEIQQLIEAANEKEEIERNQNKVVDDDALLDEIEFAPRKNTTESQSQDSAFDDQNTNQTYSSYDIHQSTNYNEIEHIERKSSDENLFSSFKKNANQLFDKISSKVSNMKMFAFRNKNEEKEDENNQNENQQQFITQNQKNETIESNHQIFDPLAQSFQLFSDDEDDLFNEKETSNNKSKSANEQEFDFLFEDTNKEEAPRDNSSYNESSNKYIDSNDSQNNKNKKESDTNNEYDFLFDNDHLKENNNSKQSESVDSNEYLDRNMKLEQYQQSSNATNEFDFLYDTDHLKDESQNNQNEKDSNEVLEKNIKSNQSEPSSAEVGYLLETSQSEQPHDNELQFSETLQNEQNSKDESYSYLLDSSSSQQQIKTEENNTKTQEQYQKPKFDEHDFDFLFEDPTEVVEKETANTQENDIKKSNIQTINESEFDFLFEDNSKDSSIIQKEEKPKTKTNGFSEEDFDFLFEHTSSNNDNHEDPMPK